jgi:uncharacterized protein
LAEVKVMDEFEIPIHGLKEGIHKYEYKIESGFFEYFKNPDLPDGKVNVCLSINKRPQFLELDFEIIGKLCLICDRCLEMFDFEVNVKNKLFIRFGIKFEEIDDNVIVIPREESRISIAQYIYEFTALSIPYKKVHPDNEKGKTTCNPEMIKKLNELKVEENYIKNDNTDPRWDKLKNLN